MVVIWRDLWLVACDLCKFMCIHILDISNYIRCTGERSGDFLDLVPLMNKISSFIVPQVSYDQVRWLIFIFAGFSQSYFAGLWQREPESFTHDCEFCQAGRSMLKALAGFHLKDSLSVHMSVGFSSVFQISLNSSSILLPCDGETCEPVNSTSDCLRNMFRRELSVNSSHKDAGWICVWYLISSCCTILVCSSAFQIFTFLLGR